MVTLHFIPYDDLSRLSSDERVEQLLSIAKEEKLILLEGRLTAKEEATLIKRTMEEIDDTFSGIEISPIQPRKRKEEDLELFRWLRTSLVEMLQGERQGMTIIGPANIVKEIKADPTKVQIFNH